MPDPEALKPCPLCGGKAIPRGRDVHWIECDVCELETHGTLTREAAAKLWNRRTPAPGVEREDVARALHAAFGPFADFSYPWDDPMCSRPMFYALTDAIIAMLPQKEGWKLVPEEPTKPQRLAMQSALLDNYPIVIDGHVCTNGALLKAIYRAAIRAISPAHEGGEA